jgi:cyclopropane-fatty-acyl-phospholipid synthase
MKIVERCGIGVLGVLVRAGTLHVTLPGGARVAVGHGAPEADLVLRDYSALSDVLRRGVLGFAEAHMDGRVDVPDLPTLMRWAVANRESWFSHPLARLTGPVRGLWQRIRPERRHPRVVTIDDHYNLGNDFYAAWLDDTMTYSSARFAHPGQALLDAQINKYRTIADHVRLEPGMRVLDIGCGWGGFAEYAAERRGCEVVAVTVAEEHAASAGKRIAARGLAGAVEIRLADFREVDGEFDAVVSIEMIESMDETRWPELFTSMARCLRPGGVAVMQAITIEDRAWARYRRRADFIQQYVFPGGQIPAPKVLRRLAAQAGLQIEQVETFGLDYARTLATWRDRFEAAWPELASEHHLDERFHRMWNLYLSLCEAGFRMGRIDVGQWVFARRGGAVKRGDPNLRPAP